MAGNNYITIRVRYQYHRPDYICVKVQDVLCYFPATCFTLEDEVVDTEAGQEINMDVQEWLLRNNGFTVLDGTAIPAKLEYTGVCIGAPR